MCEASLNYMRSVYKNGGGDILIPIRMLQLRNTSQYENALYESASFMNDTYFNGQYLSIDDNNPLQCIMYGLLLNNLVYGIDVETGEKKIYTLSKMHLNSMLKDGLLAEDTGKDVHSKTEKMIRSIESNSKIKQSFKTNNLLYAYRLDDCKHEGTDFRKHFKPMSPRDFIDLNKTVLVPMQIYDVLSEEYLRLLEGKNIVYVETSDGRVGLFSLNREIQLMLFDKKRKATKGRDKELMELLKSSINTGTDIDRYSSMAIANLTASAYSSGVNRLSIDSIAVSYVLNKEESIKFMKGEPVEINGYTFDTSLMYKDVRGAKNFLKDKLGYENLDEVKKAKLDSFTDTEAYRYLQKKGIKSMSSYATKLRLPATGHKVAIPETVADFYERLRHGVFEVTVWTKKGERKIICTTNEKIIETVYGKDWRIYCNSPSSRLREFLYKLGFTGDVLKKEKYIKEYMKPVFGIPYKVFDLPEDVEVTPEIADLIHSKLERIVADIKPSTQKSNQVLITCLTDRSPKEGAGRNLTRSFYIDYVKELKILKDIREEFK